MQRLTTVQNHAFNPKRPKVSLRRFKDVLTRLAIKEYILNRGTQAEGVSLANLESLYGCGPGEAS